MFTVLLGTDESGSFPLVLREGDLVYLDENLEWRVVATTDDYAEAVAVADLLSKRRVAADGSS